MLMVSQRELITSEEVGTSQAVAAVGLDFRHQEAAVVGLDSQHRVAEGGEDCWPRAAVVEGWD